MQKPEYRREPALWAMGMKVAVGLAVGVLTGLARMKTGNAYLSILIHAAWNTFGR